MSFIIDVLWAIVGPFYSIRTNVHRFILDCSCELQFIAALFVCFGVVLSDPTRISLFLFSICSFNVVIRKGIQPFSLISPHLHCISRLLRFLPRLIADSMTG